MRSCFYPDDILQYYATLWSAASAIREGWESNAPRVRDSSSRSWSIHQDQWCHSRIITYGSPRFFSRLLRFHTGGPDRGLDNRQLSRHLTLEFYKLVQPTSLYRFERVSTKIYGCFLLGYYIGRNELYKDLEDHRPTIKRVAIFGLAIGIPMNLLYASNFYADESWVRNVSEALAMLPMSAAYAALLCLLWIGRRRTAAWCVCSGRPDGSDQLCRPKRDLHTDLFWNRTRTRRNDGTDILPADRHRRLFVSSRT